MSRAGVAGIVVLATLTGLTGWAVGLSSTVLDSGFRTQCGELMEEDGTTVGVLVAARNLPVGATITRRELMVVSLPPEYMPDQTFLLADIDQLVGRKVTARLLKHEAIREARLSPP